MMIMLSAVLIGFECLVIPLNSLIIGRSYERLEKNVEAEKNVRIINAIKNEYDQLSSIVLDWSIWDESYNFVFSRSPAFAKSNLSAESLRNIKVDVLCYFDRSGKLLWKSQYDFKTKQKSGIDLFPETYIPPDHPFMRLLTRNISEWPVPVSGLYRTNTGIIVVSACRIMRSDGSGKPAGILVMGRSFDSDFLSKMESLTQYRFSVKSPDKVGTDESDSPMSSDFVIPGSFVRKSTGGNLIYYTPISDVDGKILVYLCRESTREIISKEKMTILFLQFSFLIAGFAGTIIVYFLLHRWVVVPVTTLLEKIRGIKKSGDFSGGIPVLRPDEIGKLTHEFNSLMHMVKYQNVVLEEKNSQLEGLSKVDPLTKISNRRTFDTVLEREWARTKRGNLEIALLMIDIDFFKNLNDRYGHVKGDEYLFKIAQAIKNSVKRPSDVVARYGGEEFAVVLPNTGVEGAFFVARVILKSVEGLNLPYEDSPTGRVSVSIGISSIVPDQLSSSFNIIEKADHALYAAKSAGRNRIMVYERDAMPELKKN
jgi:diguanylate cyclase (GGDEF)-like protein